MLQVPFAMAMQRQVLNEGCVHLGPCNSIVLFSNPVTKPCLHCCIYVNIHTSPRFNYKGRQIVFCFT